MYNMKNPNNINQINEQPSQDYPQIQCESVIIKCEPIDEIDTSEQCDSDNNNMAQDNIRNGPKDSCHKGVDSNRNDQNILNQHSPLPKEKDTTSNTAEVEVKLEIVTEDEKGERDSGVDPRHLVKSEILMQDDCHSIFLQERRKEESPSNSQQATGKSKAKKDKIKEKYYCPHCERPFQKKAHFNRHLLVHNGDSHFTCDICQKQFTAKTNLTRHKHIHTNSEQHSCDVCGKIFLEKYYLRAHLKTHLGIKTYKCSECNKAFLDRAHLIRHERVHTGARPYQCEVCKKQFTQSAHLSCHRKIHLVKKVHYCDICKEGFIEQKDLFEHNKVHIGEKAFSCGVCHRQFGQKAHLADHIRTHTGLRPYICFICNKTFRQSSTLSRHVKIHSGLKPFTCEICEKKFGQKSHLSKHYLMHKKQNETDEINGVVETSDLTVADHSSSSEENVIGP